MSENLHEPAGPVSRRATGLVLSVAGACGSGHTELAAFDDALLRVGAANYNLVRLSSVVPPGSRIVQHDGAVPHPGGEWGDRLYGHGLFVEHEGESEAFVRRSITTSLTRSTHAPFKERRRELIGRT